MVFMRSFIQTVLLFVAAAVASPQAFAGDGIVGTWNLVAITTETTDTGEVAQPYGEHPHGRLAYTSGGHMMATLTSEGRKQIGANRFAGSVEDQAEAYKTMSAYAGTYTVTDTGVIHHVEVASIESWMGSDQVRFTKLEGNTLTIKSPPLFSPPDGKRRVITLVWQRIE
jgi:hypothetical protein